MSEVLYEPSPWQQAFHAADVQELLGAGAAGPGKTTTLLMDPVQQIVAEHNRCLDKHHPHRMNWGDSKGWALFLRREFVTLDDVIARSMRVFPRVDPDASFERSRSTWHFRSGYRLQFGHCQNVNDWEKYYSSEFCVAEGTLVKMADGTLRPIEAIVSGDEVMTLEGPRRVTATWDQGQKPCVEVAVQDPCGRVERQVHPTTHPVLVATTDGSPFQSTQDCSQSVLRSRDHGFVWQDYESLLCGFPESPVRRVSRVGQDGCFVSTCGEHLELQQLEPLSVQLVLHAPQIRPGDACQRFSTGCCGSECKPGQCSWRCQEPSLCPPGSHVGLRRTEGSCEPDLGHDEGIPACGGAGARLGSETATGCWDRCCTCLRPDGGRLQTGASNVPGLLLRPDDAASPAHTFVSTGGLEHARTHTPSACTWYPHFYSGEARPRKEGVRIATGTIRFAGFRRTFDLTVEGANHYITHFGIVNAQTWVGYDEVRQFTKEQYDQINSRVRTTDPVLKNMLRIRCASNPGTCLDEHNPNWLREYFVDPAPKGNVVLKKKIKRRDGSTAYRTRMYLPATLYDNPDKEFVAQYEETLLSRPAHIRQQLLYGNWYATVGAFFGDDWNPSLHVVKPFKIARDWPRFRAMDWGYKTNGVIGWFAMDYDGNLYCEREFSFREMTATEVAKRVREYEQEQGLWKDGRSLLTGPADTQLWEERGETAMSKAEEFAAQGVMWRKADKKSRAKNAERLLARLKDHRGGSTLPGIMFFENCKKCIQTIPTIMGDPNDSETPQKGGDDHWVDMVMYACAYASRGAKGVGVTHMPSLSDDDEDDTQDASAPKPSRGRYGYGSSIL